MILSAMVQLLLVGLVGAAGALLGDAGLCRLGLPSRWSWLAGMALGPAVLAASRLPAWTPRLPGALDAAVVIPLAGITVGGAEGTGWAVLLERGLAALWLVLSLGVLAALWRGRRLLARERSGWTAAEVLGRPVLLSERRGPAVGGLLTPWIVLPAWALRLPDAELEMILLHEGEHVRAGDSRTLAAALALVALTPWNPVVWWQLHRLRAAVEVDCDRRVLARRADRRAYGAVLLAVAARSAPVRALALAAFFESPRSLQARILAMTTPRSRWTRPAGATLVLLAALVTIQACGMETPVGPAPVIGTRPAPRAVEGTVGAPTGRQISPTPSFTPFTKAPSLTNREVVGRALEESYPPLLKDAGVGGRVEVWVQIGATGLVENVAVNQTSGHEPLDLAALRVARVMAFTPAEDRGAPVPVWVSIPITFQAERPASQPR